MPNIHLMLKTLPKLLGLLLLLNAIITIGYSQVTITTSHSAQSMAQMLGGPGITITNAHYNGTCDSSTQSGKFFASSPTALGLDSGILLTSGQSALAVGASATPSVSTNNPGDPDLAILSSPQASWDACILEFDFVPIGDTIKFKYVFASAEYQIFSCSIADVFGFFISGPGITGPFSLSSANVALLPNGCYVGVNTVNGQTSSPCGNATAPCAPPNNALFYSNLPIGNTTTGVAYNGYTLPMYAIAAVQPCSTYHLKLAISDASDHILDSGVFLEAGSLSSNNVALSFNTGLGVANPFIVEGCDSLVVRVTRKLGSATVVLPDTVGVDISGSAIMGLDYNTVPSSVYFSSSITDTLQTIVIYPYLDGIAENGDFITIKLLQGCNGSVADSITLFIKDSLSFMFNNPNVAICDGQSVITNGAGYPGMTFTWSPASTVLNPNQINTTITPNVGVQTYSVTSHYLLCPAETKSFTITTDPIPVVNLASNYSLCNGSTVQLSGTVSPANGLTYSWSPNNNLLQATSLNPIFNGTNSQSINLTAVTNNAQCTTTANTQITVYNIASGSTNFTDTLVCGGTAVQIIASGGLGNYLWYPNSYISCTNCPDPIVNPPLRTVYNVVFLEPHGCQDTSQVDVQINPPFTLTLVNKDTTIEAGDQIQLTSYGAFGYNWMPNYYLSAVNTGIVYASPIQDITYTIIGTDTFNSCPQEYSFNVKVIEKDLWIPNAFTPNGDGTNDVIRITSKKYMKLQEFRIFNRWGNEVFMAKNINEAWDGTINSKPCDAGMYYYRARWVFPSGKIQEMQGDIMLMR
jgi:gliding motility-associated-like protein